MKRLLSSLIALALIGAALAQAPFTIVRPADGSKVREEVHILFPKNSIPDGGYIGIFVNGNFIEATIPRTGSKYLEYILDTKALGLADGPLNVEAVLYVNFEEKPRIVDRSSIQVTLANKASISVPEDGFKLRYHWQAGREWSYRWDNSVSYSTISEAQARLGGHAAELPVESYSAQLIYAMDNVYSDGDALVRMQPAPPKGKRTVVLPVNDNPEPKMFFDYQMAPLYMRLRPTGLEVYGALPVYFPFEGQSGVWKSDELYASLPLPTLPTKAIRPGDSWGTQFQIPLLENLDEINVRNSVMDKIPARGEFEGVEWEMGYPCAKIHKTLSVGTGGGIGANKIKNNAQSIDETFWFALDRGVVVKLIRTMVIDKELNGTPSNTPTQPSGNSPSAPARGRGRRGNGGGTAGEVIIPFNQKGRGLGGGGGGEYGPAQGAQGGGQGQAGAPAPAPAPQGNQLYRITFTEVATLEK